MGPEALAVVAAMLGVTLLERSRLRARRCRASTTAWSPAAATLAAAAPTGRWGEPGAPPADFGDWPPRPAPGPGPGAPEDRGSAPRLDQLDADELDDVLAGREPHGRFAREELAVAAPGAAFRSTARRRGMGGLLGHPGVRAAAAAAGRRRAAQQAAPTTPQTAPAVLQSGGGGGGPHCELGCIG